MADEIMIEIETPDGTFGSLAEAADHGYTFTCEWFARCQRNATTLEPHPVLGAVPTCDRCSAFIHEGEEKL